MKETTRHYRGVGPTCEVEHEFSGATTLSFTAPDKQLGANPELGTIDKIDLDGNIVLRDWKGIRHTDRRLSHRHPCPKQSLPGQLCRTLNIL
jgi:hypothetical protein